MSEHDVADCPECGKRDFVLKEDNVWVCLNPECKFTEKMPKSKFDPDSDSDSGLLSMVIAALIAVAFVLVALGV